MISKKFPAIYTCENPYFQNRLHGEDHGTNNTPKSKTVSLSGLLMYRFATTSAEGDPQSTKIHVTTPSLNAEVKIGFENEREEMDSCSKPEVERQEVRPELLKVGKME